MTTEMPRAHSYKKKLRHISDMETAGGGVKKQRKKKKGTHSSRSDRSSSSVVRSVTGDELPVTDVVMPASLVVTSAAVVSAVSAEPSCDCTGALFSGPRRVSSVRHAHFRHQQQQKRRRTPSCPSLLLPRLMSPRTEKRRQKTDPRSPRFSSLSSFRLLRRPHGYVLLLLLHLHLFQWWLWLFLWFITCNVRRCDRAIKPTRGRRPETAPAQLPALHCLAAPAVVAVDLVAVVLASLKKQMSKPTMTQG